MSQMEMKNLIKAYKKEIKAYKKEIDKLQQKDTESQKRIEELEWEKENLKNNDSTAESARKKRGKGVAIVRTSNEEKVENLKTEKHNKSESSIKLIRGAINKNDYMREIDSEQVDEIIHCMYKKQYGPGSVIIKEKTFGNQVFVIEEGTVQVQKDKHIIRHMGRGELFGERALLYDFERSATIEAQTLCKLWVIERRSFQKIMTRVGLQKRQEHLEFIKTIPDFTSLAEEKLSRIVDVVEENCYEPGDYIIRQGTVGDRFYMIYKGTVNVTQNSKENPEKENFLRVLGKGACFGEKALESEDKRSANIIANEKETVCLYLYRDSYKQLIEEINNMGKTYEGLIERTSVELNRDSVNRIRSEFERLSVKDFTVVETIGKGGFGNVDLVYRTGENTRTFALKRFANEAFSESMVTEERILAGLKSDFIIKLYSSFVEGKYTYILLEVCLGGDLFSHFNKRQRFDDKTARFYAACVLEAFTYLHSKHIVYRDLKPENIVIDSQGYGKLIDFGIAIHLPPGRKSWTFCGTPGYFAPEIIQYKGHDSSVDIWSLGILIHELLAGQSPFYHCDNSEFSNFRKRNIDMVDFLDVIKKYAQQLIKKLCKNNPSERLGSGINRLKDIRKHRWFDGFNWSGLRNRSLKAPIIPKVDNIMDLSNFTNQEDERSSSDLIKIKNQLSNATQSTKMKAEKNSYDKIIKVNSLSGNTNLDKNNYHQTELGIHNSVNNNKQSSFAEPGVSSKKDTPSSAQNKLDATQNTYL